MYEESVEMEEFWRGIEQNEPEEVVLTYRQEEDIEPVVLRYERDLPESMRPRNTADTDDRFSRAPSPINPPEKQKSHWGVRVYVGVSLLLIVACLGAGIWYFTQHGLDKTPVSQSGSPGASSGEKRPWSGVPYSDYYYYWDAEDEEELPITIPSYPTGGAARLTLSSASELPVLTAREVYNNVNPSVVTVVGTQKTSPTASVGTGIIFSPDGYIVTNCHVIAGCSRCSVWITNTYGIDTSYDAKVVGYDEEADLAVLKVDSQSELPPAEFGVSDDLQVGDTVYAIGSPLGMELRNTLTSGIASAVNRDVDVDGVTMTLIQTTAALNSGNSGGPLINQYGQVIGINTIKMMSSYDTIEGLGFAIPSSIARRWVNELIEFGELQPQPVLGVTVNRIPETMPDGTIGLHLEGVTPGLSGDRAGLRSGDYLVGFDGQDIVGYEQLLSIRRELHVGDEVAVRVYRDGAYVDATMIMMAE